MISAPHKVFLDTQIIIDVERGSIPPVDWSLAVSYLRNVTRYCISPLTIGEITYALVKGNAKYFEQHQRRLRVLLSPGADAEVFDFIPYFFAQKFGLEIQRPTHLEDNFLGTIKLILEAPSKDALLQGFPSHGDNSNRIARVRIDRFAEEHDKTIERYIEFMENRRRYDGTQISPQVWASSLLALHGVSEGDADPSEVAERFSATYEFEMSMNNLMRSKGFSVARNRSDLVDLQQLCYLCDPSVVFISNDSDFANRTSNSPQSNRIKTFARLLASATNRSMLL